MNVDSNGFFRPRRMLRSAGLVAILAMAWACYPVAETSFSNPQDTGVMQWLIEQKTGESRLHMTLRYSRQNEKGRSSSSNGFMIAPEQLEGLTRAQMMSAGTNVKFQLRRDAGTFHFEGWFREGNGSGHFNFSPNSSFATQLSQQGFGSPTPEQQLSLALNDIGFALIDELKSQGYDKPTLAQLVKMGHHGVRLEYVKGMGGLGYRVKSIDQLIKLRDHGVTLKFIQELADLGYQNVPIEQLLRTRDHGVTARFINEFVAAGYRVDSLEEWVKLRDHGVTTKYVTELAILGYEKLPLEQLRRMRDHGVTTRFIQELKDIGFDRVPVEQLIRLKDHGVSANYIQRMKERGHSLSLDGYIDLKDRGTR